MKALVYHGPNDIRCDDVAEPTLRDDQAAIIRVTSAGICGSDLHIYSGHGFSEDVGFTVGHEAVGEVVEVGASVRLFTVGDRVLVPASVGCSQCSPCRVGHVGGCETSSSVLDSCYGLSSRLPGGQAEFLAVPNADGNLFRLPHSVSDEAGVVLTDSAATAWYGARRARISPGDTVTVIGLGPVGQMAVQSALVMGASRVFGIDLVPDRRARASELGAEAIEGDDPKAEIRAQTDGRGTDVVIEAVGADATIKLATSVTARGGRLSVIGVSQNPDYRFNMALAQAKELEFTIGLCSVHRELPTLLRLTAAGRLKPEAIVTHRIGLTDGPRGYKMFAGRTDNVGKIILDPTR